MRPSARSLILDLLSTLRRGTMPVSALVAAGGLFGIAGNSVRVALARLLASGRVERDVRGRYRLGPGAQPVQRLVSGWREQGRRVRPWSGAWIGVHGAALPAPGSRAARTRRERALRLLGLRELAAGLFVRPDNLRGGLDGVRRDLEALGVEGAPVFAMRDLDAATDARARGLWDVEALSAGYRASLARLEESGRRLPHAPPEDAMVESFLLGGRVLAQLAFDPLLPEPIAPAADRDALVTAMRGYDRLGRAAWAEFLAGHGVPHLRTPADGRLADAADVLAAAS